MKTYNICDSKHCSYLSKIRVVQKKFLMTKIKFAIFYWLLATSSLVLSVCIFKLLSLSLGSLTICCSDWGSFSDWRWSQRPKLTWALWVNTSANLSTYLPPSFPNCFTRTRGLISWGSNSQVSWFEIFTKSYFLSFQSRNLSVVDRLPPLTANRSH